MTNVANTRGNGPAAIDLVTGMVELSLSAVDALDRKLALVLPVLGTVAALLLPDSLRSPMQVQLASAAGTAGTLAIALALKGLAGRQTSIGADPAGMAARLADDPSDFYSELMGPYTIALEQISTLTATKAWHLNMALVAAAVSTLLFLIVRLLSVA